MEKACFSLKATIAGDSNCKIDEIVRKIIGQPSDNQQSSYEIESVIIDENDTRYKIQLWTTLRRFETTPPSSFYFRNAIGAFVVYNAASRSSFNSIPKYIERIRALAIPNAIIIVVCNRCNPTDVIEVTAEEGEAFAKNEKLLFHELLLYEDDNKLNEYLHHMVENFHKNPCVKSDPPSIDPPSIDQPKKKKYWFNFFKRDDADK